MFRSYKKGEPRFHKDTIGVRGVSLPVKAIRQLQEGIKRPTSFTNKVLESLYKRYQYHELRKAGASVAVSKDFARGSISDARRAILQYATFINKIAKRKHLKDYTGPKGEKITGAEIISAGLRRSERAFADFLYFLEKDLLGRDSPKSKGKGR